MLNILIDTDVILDVYLHRIDFFVNSSRVLNSIDKGYYNGFTSSVSIVNAYYFLKKEYKNQKAINILKEIRNMITILSVSEKIIGNAINSNFKDFEDAVQYHCALENNIECIITRNKKDYSKAQIPVYTPMEFINIITE